MCFKSLTRKDLVDCPYTFWGLVLQYDLIWCLFLSTTIYCIYIYRILAASSSHHYDSFTSLLVGFHVWWFWLVSGWSWSFSYSKISQRGWKDTSIKVGVAFQFYCFFLYVTLCDDDIANLSASLFSFKASMFLEGEAIRVEVARWNFHVQYDQTWVDWIHTQTKSRYDM